MKHDPVPATQVPDPDHGRSRALSNDFAMTDAVRLGRRHAFAYRLNQRDAARGIRRAI
jgi:hypothetical protein